MYATPESVVNNKCSVCDAILCSPVTKELLILLVYTLEVSDCDILRSSRFWNIKYHDCENNHDYKILTIFDESFMQQVMLD